MSPARRCRHRHCTCAAPGDGDYCSPYCANASQVESLPGEAELDGACSCRHEGCGSEVEPGALEPEPDISTGRT